MVETQRTLLAFPAQELAKTLDGLDEILHEIENDLNHYPQKLQMKALQHAAAVCEARILVNRIFMWSAFRSEIYMAFDGESYNVIDTSNYSVDWAGAELLSVQSYLASANSDLDRLERARARHMSVCNRPFQVNAEPKTA